MLAAHDPRIDDLKSPSNTAPFENSVPRGRAAQNPGGIEHSSAAVSAPSE